MKKFLLALSIALVGLGASAQTGQMAAGLNLNYGSETKSLGIGGKFQYNFTNAFRGDASAGYFFENDNVSMWDVNLNLHYIFHITDQFKVYPLSGVAVTTFDVDGDSESRIGLNLGGGIQYDFSKRFSLNAETKYQFVSDFDQAVLTIGTIYRF